MSSHKVRIVKLWLVQPHRISKTSGENWVDCISREATSEEWYGYLQGAYLSGKEKAQIIAGNVNDVPPLTDSLLDIHEEL